MQSFTRVTSSSSGSRASLLFRLPPLHTKKKKPEPKLTTSRVTEVNLMRGSPTEINGLVFLSPAMFGVSFADGHYATSNVSVFGMPVDRLRWKTLRVAQGGKAITVIDIAGEPV